MLVTILVTSLFFMNTKSLVGDKVAEANEPITAGMKEYDPWTDINDDGVIDVKDYQLVKARIPSMGSPVAKAAILYDSGWLNITDKAGQNITLTHNLNSTDIIVDITGRITVDGGTHQRNFGLTGQTSGWTRTYGGIHWDSPNSVIQTSDGGYAIAGKTEPSGTFADFWLVKTDSNGAQAWSKTYGGINADAAYSVIQTSDEGYAIIGVTYSFGVSGDCCLVKTDMNGVMQWSRVFGGTNSDLGYSVVQTGDGEYVIAGETSSYGAGNADFWLIKTDADGNLIWNRTFGGSNTDSASTVVQTTDGGYALAGYTSSFGAGSYDLWLIKTDANGNMQWNKTYGGAGTEYTYTHAQSVVQTVDGGYALAGETSSFGAGYDDFWLVKTDSVGNIQWNKTYGGESYEMGCSMVQTKDGGYALAGDTLSYGAGSEDFWLVKTDVESGLAWIDSTPNSIVLYRGATDAYWNFVRAQIWKIIQ
jgi:hypothetical protein